MRRISLWLLLFILVGGPCQALTQADLRFRVSEKLGQDTSSTNKHWSNAAQNAFIDDAIRYISHVALCYTRDTTFALEVSKTDYTMPSDYIKAEAVIVGWKAAAVELDRSPLGLKPTAPADMGKSAVTDLLPTQWYDKGERVRRLRMTPTPQVIDSCTVTYFAYGRLLTGDTMSCDLPVAFQLVVPHLAAADLWSKTRQGNPFWQEFVDRISILVPSFRKDAEAETPSATPGP